MSTGVRAPKVVIIVLNWNRWQDTVECLESIRHLAYPDYLTVVVDNASGDHSGERIEAWAAENLDNDHTFVEYMRETALQGGEQDKEESIERALSDRRIVLISNRENLGFTGGNNVAIQYAVRREYPADYVLLLNNDAKIEPSCLVHLVKADRAANAGVVGPVIMDETGKIDQCRGKSSLVAQFFAPLARTVLPPPAPEDAFWTSSWISGACMLIRKDVLDAVCSRLGQYLDSSLFMYGEDLEFCALAGAAGYRCVVAKQAVVFHAPSRSSGGPVACYYITRNRPLLARRLLPQPWKILFNLFHIAITLLRATKHVIYGRPRIAHGILSGLIDGRRGVTGKWKHHDRRAAPLVSYARDSQSSCY